MRDFSSTSQNDENDFGHNDERFKQLVKNSFDIISLLDRNGKQIYVSESCERILGYSPEELKDSNVIEEYLHPDDWDKVYVALAEILDHKSFGGIHYRHKRKNGGWVYLEAFGSNQLENPYVNAIVLNVRDITKRKKAEDELAKSEAALFELNATKDRFFSIIGHDLRTPFSAILGVSDLLIKQFNNNNYEEADELITLINQSARQAYNLLENLLEWSRAQTGKITFNPTAFDFSEIVRGTITLLQDAAREKSISITTSLPEPFPIVADTDMIQTVLRNLLSNGIKFTPNDGHINIKGEILENEIRVSVTDSGVGISPSNAKKLFSIEESCTTQGTNNETGTGLGLLLCKEFIEIHDGKIWVTSTPKKGSTFTFALPIRNAEPTKKKNPD